MNPEFQRQLWLQFSAPRLILMPVLLFAGGLAVVLTSRPDLWPKELALAAVIGFMLLVGGLGVRAAGTSVLDELTERTWDQQRMSAMQPWAMTWGKLAGATAYSWYGGAICLAVAVPCAWALHYPLLGLKLAALVLAGILLQALMLAVNLQLAKLDGRLARQGQWLWVAFLLPLPQLFRMEDQPVLSWWGQSWSTPGFLVGSLLLFVLCALVAAWRSMAESLAVRQLPWGWPVLGLVLTLYFSGFDLNVRLHTVGVVGVWVCGALTYFALVSEPQPRPMWQRVAARGEAGRWRAALEQLPRWPTSLAAALLFGLLSGLGEDVRSGMLPGTALAWALLLVRDCALALFFAFAPRARRPLGAFLVAMLVLHALMPWLAQAPAPAWVRGLLYPPVDHFLAATSLINGMALLHAALALGLLAWRWKATRPAA